MHINNICHFDTYFSCGLKLIEPYLEWRKNTIFIPEKYSRIDLE